MDPKLCKILCRPSRPLYCPPSCISPPTGYSYRPPPPRRPLPPPPPPPLRSPHQISNGITLILSVLASVFILMTVVSITRKYCSNRNSDSRSSSTAAPPRDNNAHEEGHNVRNLGLQETVINSITVCKYKRGEGLVEGTECSICLNEFRDNENLRLLPGCVHTFHPRCIDTWLKSNVNCPLCRTSVISDYYMSSQSRDPSSFSSSSDSSSSTTTTTSSSSASSSSSSSSSSGSSEERLNRIGLERNGSNWIRGSQNDQLGAAVEMVPNDDTQLVVISSSTPKDSTAASTVVKEVGSN